MRQVAHHIWIRELLEGDYEEREGWEPNVLHTGRGDVSRVNILGTVISLNGQQLLDDGTGQIMLRAFEEIPGLKDAQSGQFCIVIGRPRTYQEQLFLVPEVVRPVDALWGLVRKSELGAVKHYEQLQHAVEDEKKEVFVNDAEKIVAIINGLDAGDGAMVGDVVEKSGLNDRAEPIINQLLLDGEIFEIKPGVVKVL